MQISCPETQWNILVYFLKFGSSILHKCKKRLIGHMANNKYSITCVHQSVFSHLKNDRCSSENGQLVALENALVALRFSHRL